MSDTATPRLSLPYILSGQSQKEVTHAEALNALDLWVQPVAAAAGLTAPPSSPADGAIYIVAVGASGSWAGHDHEVAQWFAGAWRFFAPFDGLRIWIADSNVAAIYMAGGWEIGRLRGSELRIGGLKVVGAQVAAIADPSGGATVDAAARTAIASILGALRAHGLVAS